MDKGPNFRLRPVSALGAIAVIAGLLGGCAASPADHQPSLAEAKAAYQRQDYWTAAQLLKPLAYQGNAEAQYALGYLYYYGRGVKQNRSWAMSWFGEAIRLGHPKAERALASLRSEARLTRHPGHPALRASRGEQTRAEPVTFPERRPPVTARTAVRPDARSTSQSTRPELSGEGDAPVKAAGHPTTVDAVNSEPTGAPARQPGEGTAERTGSGQASSSGAFRDDDRPARDAARPKAPPAQPQPVADFPAAGGPSKKEPITRPEQGRGKEKTTAARPRFTLQLIGSSSKADLVALVERFDLHDVRYFRSERHGRPWYRLLYRGFDSLAAARRALKGLPAAMGRHKPWVRNYPSVKLAALKQLD